MTFLPKNSYSKQELLDCAEGNLFGSNNGRLPTPNMLMFDRLTEISEYGGKYNKASREKRERIKPTCWIHSRNQKESNGI